ncbi:protein BatD [Cryomorpha ignava]|uniref:Protein BatD n=1 Tax=Cryomorpha ignava TaxID=101383 RepID=A0A7K3WX41_9FLAO|nr:BatD family protein [Cryomorpha ignava]NEN25641.1 protein BatD [Cryomorpha ignava]
MKKTGNHIIFLLFACLSVFAAKAQETAFYATVDKNPVGTGDVFSYQITLENGRGDITPPSLADFNVVFGPSRSSNYRIVNGEQTSAITLSYTMRPKSKGEFTIDPAQALVNGKRFKTESITVKVIEGSSSRAPQTNRNQNQSNQSASNTSNENLKVQIQLSKRKVYLGEQITATYVILTRFRNIDIEGTKFPGLAGFWTEDLKTEQARWEREYEMVNGVPYRKAVLKRQILFPQRTGKIQIDPLTISSHVNRSFLNPGEEVNMASNSPTIEVMPLPGKVPESYNGAVGEFTFSANIDRTELPANEAINLKIIISGSGNLSLIKEPELKFPPDFETYDPETKDRINVSGAGVTGSRSFQYLVIPRYPGDYEIPEIIFTYFDPAKEAFVTKSEGPFPIKVTGSAASVSKGQRSQNIVKQTTEDIRYINTLATSLESKNKQFFKSMGYYAGIGAPFIGFILFLAFRKKRATELDDVQGTRRRKANKMARRRLKMAEKALKADDSKQFYAEIFKALYGYMSDKLGIPGSLLSRQVIVENLKERNIDDGLIHELSDTIETCEMARFAAVAEMSNREFYNQTVKLISKLDSRIK